MFLDFASAIQRYGKEQINIKGLDENDTDLITELGKEVVRQSMVICFRCMKRLLMTTIRNTNENIPAGTLHYGWYMGRL